MNLRSLLTIAILAVGLNGEAFAQTVTFSLIPGAASARDMSPDGRYIVGFANGSPYLLDRQTETMTQLPPPGLNAVAVSDDGQVVLGDIPDPTGVGSNVAAIWTAATGWESLGFLPNALACPSRSDAYDLSGDGSTAVGLSWDGCSGRGFVWTEATGMQELQVLANGGNRASVISSDGSLIGGFAQGSFSRTPSIWGNDLIGELLDPPNGDALGEVLGMRDDGSAMLGTWTTINPTSQAVKWELIDGIWERELVGNGSLVAGWAGTALDIADDGTIVGFDSLLTSRRAWIQYQGDGDLVLLKAWANSFGAKIPAEISLDVCRNISADGRTLIGDSLFSGAWIINIEPAALIGDVNCDGEVNLLDVAPFVELITNGEFDAKADINSDGEVNLLDVSPFVMLLSN